MLALAPLLGLGCAELAELSLPPDEIVSADIIHAETLGLCSGSDLVTTRIELQDVDDVARVWTVTVPRPRGEPTWPLRPARGLEGERARLQGPGLPRSGAYALDGLLELGPKRTELTLRGEFTHDDGDLVEVRVHTLGYRPQTVGSCR